MCFFWANLITHYPEVQDHVLLINDWHHAMGMEIELEENEYEENTFHKINGGFTISDPACTDPSIVLMHSNNFEVLHLPDIFTPPPEFKTSIQNAYL